MPKTNLKSYLHLHFLVFIWGFTAILGALISLNAVPLVWYRILFAAIILFVYFIIKRKSIKTSARALIHFFIGGIIIASHWIAFFSAIKIANISVALVTLSTGAFFASLIEPIFFKRKVIPSELFFGLTVVFGLYLIFSFEGELSLGVLYALIAAFLSALFSVYNGLLVKKYDADVISFYQLVFGVVFITSYVLATTGFELIYFTLKNYDLFYLLILSSICTAYAFVISVKLMKNLTPYTLMLTINLEPVYGIILAVLIFGNKEKMSPTFYIGAGIVVLIVIVNGIIKNKKTI